MMCGDGFVEEREQEEVSPAMRARFVKFVDGAYTKWHYHTGEQILLVTEGRGFVEYQDRPSLSIQSGARILVPRGVWHRHGALDKVTLVHLAVTYGETEWADEDPCRRDTLLNGKLSLSPVSEIKYLNDRILQGEESGQGADLMPLLGKDFFIVRSSGEKLDRQAFLDAVPKNANRGRKAFDENVHLVDRSGVFTCVVTTTQDPDGTPNPGRFWNTRVFIREEGQWRCSQWHVLRIPDVENLLAR